MITLAPINVCTGCYTCFNACTKGAIRMVSDEEGFFYPEIEEKRCVGCGLCQKSCPELSPKIITNLPEPKVYAVWHKQDRVLSSSGGAFSAVARKIISEGGIVYGASFDTDMCLVHVGISDLDGLATLRGSKYVQSRVGNVYGEIREHLRSGRKVLFCGTPCQVAGLKSYLGAENELLLTIDLVCHGAPSQRVFSTYLRKLEDKKMIGHVVGFGFRRLNGWGIASFADCDGERIHLYGEDALYMEAFDKSLIFRKSCYGCRYAQLPRVGDVTLGDFWGLGRYGTPFRYDMTEGVSLMMVNNEKAFSVVCNLDNTFAEGRKLEEAIIENANITHASVLPPNRDDVIMAFVDESRSLDSIDSQFHIVNHSIKSKVKMFADRLGFFSIAKKVYNFYKAHF